MNDLSKKVKWFLFGAGLVVLGAAAQPALLSSTSELAEFSSLAHAQSAEETSSVFVKIAEEKTPAVVNISTTQKIKTGAFGDERMREFYEKYFPWYKDIPKEQTRQSLGSGFIVEEDGHILTNNHVVEQADEIIVTFGGGNGGPAEEEYKAKLIASDPKTDIALIKIDADKKLPVLKLGDSDRLRVGEWVIAIGNPFGFSQSVTVGVVSAKGRVIGAGPYDDFIQTDASINPGNSGGPLLNIKGEVVGINSAIFTGGMSQGNIGIGFAVPINAVKNIYEDLKKGQVKRGWLGVKIQMITPELQSALGLKTPHGALISDVVKGSPAEKAGLKSGDVIIEFNKEEVPSTAQLPRMVGALKPGTEVEVKVLRDGSEKTLTVKLGNMPEAAARVARSDVSEDIGLSVSDITADMAQRFEVEAGSGVVVTDVAPGGPAASAGIRPGDIISEVNRKKVTDIGSYRNALAGSKPGDAVLFLVKRGDSSSFIAVKIPEKEKK